MEWTKVNIQTDIGKTVVAQAPIIISASRSTYIPAFYSDWFFNRLEHGYVAWKNPFNGKKHTSLLKRLDLLCFGQRIQDLY